MLYLKNNSNQSYFKKIYKIFQLKIRQSVFRLDARKMICKMKYQLIGPDQNIKLLLCKNPCEED